VVGENGKIVFKASHATQLEAGSVTSATGAGTGGEIQLLGERVALSGNAAVNASGNAGGGTVLVGGDWQGKNAALPNASRTFMGKDASIKADALVSGDGGKVVLWSNESTTAKGSISAQGGVNGGNGGKVETSGHHLDVNGIKVRAGSAKGKAGDWLLDPYDIEVVAGGTANPADTADQAKGPATGVTKVAPSALTGTGTNIRLEAQHDITITDAINASGDVTASAGNDIKVNANVVSGSGNVVLFAANSINLASGASLKGNNYIDLIANQMALAGSIGSNGGQKPIITFNPATDSLPIQIGGSASSSALWLDAAALSGYGAYGINVGSSAHTGGITVLGSLNQAGNVIMDSAGPISIHAPITAGSSGSFVATLHGNAGSLLDVGSSITAGKLIQLKGDGLRIGAPVTATDVVLAPHRAETSISLGELQGGSLSLDEAMLKNVNASNLTIGGQPGQVGSAQISGAIDLTSHAFGKLTIDSGATPLMIDAAFTMPSGALVLKGGNVSESLRGSLNVDQLAFSSGNEFRLNGTNLIGTIAGTAVEGVYFDSYGPLRIGSVAGVSGLNSDQGAISVQSSGLLTLAANVTNNHEELSLTGGGIVGNGIVRGTSVQLISKDGIGTETAPINTVASTLKLYNTQVGSKPINVSNTGDVDLVAMIQWDNDGPNTGSLKLRNNGNLTTIPSSVDWWRVRAGSGDIDIGATGTVTLNGSVSSGSGNIRLAAGGDMTISGTGGVTSGSGNLNLSAGSSSKITVLAGARVASTSGDINVTAGSTSIVDGTITGADGKVHVTTTQPTTGPGTQPPPQPPTVDQCVANPKASGCDSVLKTSRDACAANWTAGVCDQVMPPEAVQQHNALLACIANPKGANCSTVLPSVDACQGKGNQPGCDVVLAERAKVEACVATPTAACFESTLPSPSVCSAKPDTFGCAPVQARQTGILACAANPTAANCGSVLLPSLTACQADPKLDGCSATLARQTFVSCVANPAGAGCNSVLPPVDVCKLTPGKEGCAAVISHTFDLCLAKPNDPSCAGILPTVSQCVSDKSKPGCQAVLPTMNQCIGSPTLQGCAVILPRIEQCAANPNMQGCEAVLPQPSFCATHPTDPTCQVFNPSTQGTGDEKAKGSSVAQSVQTTVTLINGSTAKPAAGSGGSAGGSGSTVGNPAGGTSTTNNSGSASDSNSGTSDKNSDKQSGPAAGENSGVKNEKPATKTYCN
jgi:hypothetical protein